MVKKNIAEINKFHLVLIIAVVGAMSYTFTTFATINYVDNKHQDVKNDMKIIRDDVRELRNFFIPVNLRRKAK